MDNKLAVAALGNDRLHSLCSLEFEGTAGSNDGDAHRLCL
jgi:hypothetical protein